MHCAEDVLAVGPEGDDEDEDDDDDAAEDVLAFGPDGDEEDEDEDDDDDFWAAEDPVDDIGADDEVTVVVMTSASSAATTLVVADAEEIVWVAPELTLAEAMLTDAFCVAEDAVADAAVAELSGKVAAVPWDAPDVVVKVALFVVVHSSPGCGDVGSSVGGAAVVNIVRFGAGHGGGVAGSSSCM